MQLFVKRHRFGKLCSSKRYELNEWRENTCPQLEQIILRLLRKEDEGRRIVEEEERESLVIST